MAKERTPAQRAADKRRAAQMKGTNPFGNAKRRPDGDGNPSSANRGGGLSAHIPLHTVREFDHERIGALLTGFVSELQRPRTVDLSSYYPPTEKMSPEEARAWNRLVDERNIGSHMARGLGYALLKHGVSEADVVRWFRQSIARARSEAGAASSGGVGNAGGLSPPLAVPTVISSRFGVARADGYHRGVDLAAAEGTEVRAPWAARVVEVGEEDEGGRYVKLALQRPDGGYADDTTTGDDSGLLVTFAHLSEQLVHKGDVVHAGQPVARSGNTGRNTTGPHLHVAVEYFVDAPVYSVEASNSRFFVDPAAVWGGDGAITGTGDAAPVMPDAPVEALAFPRTGGAGSPVLMHVTNNGALAIGGNAVNVNTQLKAVFPLSSGDAIGGLPLMPDALRDVARQVMDAGQTVVEGLGNLAGRYFTRDSIGGLVEVTGMATSGAGALIGGVGAVATALTPVTAGIPYVGQIVPVVGIVGDVVGAASGVIGGVTSAVGKFIRSGEPLKLPVLDVRPVERLLPQQEATTVRMPGVVVS